MAQLVAYVDGSSHGNPGPSGIGVIVENPEGDRIRIAKWIGFQDNNVAEYVALMDGLQDIDPESDDGADIVAALAALDKLCAK